jgi:hypothetical protein
MESISSVVNAFPVGIPTVGVGGAKHLKNSEEFDEVSDFFF